MLLIGIIIIIILIITGIYLFMHQAQFGSSASGDRLKRIRSSPNFRNGAFQNINNTPALTEGASYLTIMKKFFFERNLKRNPPISIPAIQTNLRDLDRTRDVLVWFGHSSYFIILDGKTFLIDPVLNGSAAPIRSFAKSFAGTDIYTSDDLPDIDYMLITHDHWDHLDYKTMIQLKGRVGKVVTGLGTAAHLEYWGYEPAIITEADWDEELIFSEDLRIHTLTARHFSGRGLKRNQNLWLSFLIESKSKKIFIGGDSGYDEHFATIGNKFGPIDLAILENGQYDANWKYIHMMPEEVVQAGIDLRAAAILPVHWSKFSISTHDWDDSIKRILIEAEKKSVNILHPKIGEAVYLNRYKKFERWWE